MLHCKICGRRLREGEEVIPVMHVIENENRGDFVGHTPDAYIHLKHLREDDKE